MKILFLGYDETQTSLVSFLKEQGCEVDVLSGPIQDFDDPANYDLMVSFGYRHILRPEMLAKLKRPAVNLHMSYLPYNRGAHPNFWAWHDGTKHGVTIHHIDAGVDTGDIIAQKEISSMNDTSTFKETYEVLFNEIENLFKEWWPGIASASYKAVPQQGFGSCHRKKDLPSAIGWDRSIRETLKDLKRKHA